MCGEILSEHSGVGVGVVTADDDDGSDAVLLAYFCDDRKLLIRLQLRSAGTDDVESAGVSVFVDVFVIEDHVIIFDQSDRTVLEAVEHVLFVRRLQGIVQTADDVVSAWCLAA